MSALYGFAFSEASLSYLETNVPTRIRGQIKRRIEALAATPIPPGAKKLHGVMDGENPVYRVRQGDYRILSKGRVQMIAAKHQIDPDKLHMDEGEFDRVMRKALQVKAPPKKAKPSKAKAARGKGARK
jgi:mRNA-degrading endonuclease RelE of RelBE toxin-antitoxin system